MQFFLDEVSCSISASGEKDPSLLCLLQDDTVDVSKGTVNVPRAVRLSGGFERVRGRGAGEPQNSSCTAPALGEFAPALCVFAIHS